MTIMTRNIFAPFAGRVINWRTLITLRSLRLRLALWALLLLGITQVIVSAVLYTSISSWLENQVDSNLLLTATQVSSVLYDAEDATLVLEDVNLQLSGGNIATQSFLRDQLFFVRVLERSTGAIVGDSADYAIPVTTQARSTTAQFETLNFLDIDQDANTIRIYTLPLSYAPQFSLQVGVSLDETREIQGDMVNILGLLLTMTAIFAPLSGWFLANRALVPIRATARTAADINETDLTRRLDSTTAEIELEQLTQTFNAMLDRIQGAFQRQRQFTADAAHELRTPLSIMQTGLDVTLSQERKANEYRAALTTIQEEVGRLSQLTNTLLMLARADSNELTLIRDIVNVATLLNVVVDQFGSFAEDKHITLERQIAPSLLLQGDEDRLIQVALNLLDNAIKYTPPGGIVRVIAQQNHSWVEIRIEDTGPGIALAEQAQIFSRFYRVDHARNRSQGGFGLGLAIARQIVERHHGTIEVTSEPGHGSNFVVRLPLH